MVMTIHRLSAGTGYQYLLRHTATGDAARQPGQALADYYAGTGYPPGQWYGRGLTHLGDDSIRLAPGTPVTEDQMARLFGHGHDPITDVPLGRAYPAFAPLADRVARRVARLPDHLSVEDRTAAVTEIEKDEQARPQPAAVAGFDLTFSAPKSTSVLWALADPATHRTVLAAHDAAVRDVLTVLEDRALFTRVGAGGCAQVPVSGMVAAAFRHWDSRSGDPNLHTHVVVANKVADADGTWRSLDSRALHHAAVFASELYNDLLTDHLAARLPLRWSWRDRGARRSPAYEIDGLDEALLAAFSTRSADIDRAVQQAVTDFHLAHGRRPSRPEMIRLRQAATLATRPDKTPHRLGDLLTRWADRARGFTGGDPDQLVTDALSGKPHRRLRADWVGEASSARLADAALRDVMSRRATWTEWNVAASVARITRGLRLASSADRLALIDRITRLALDRCQTLDSPDPVQPTAPELRRPDGASVFTRTGERRYSHRALLAAEQRLVDAHGAVDGPYVPAAVLDRVLLAATAPPGGRVLTGDQADAVRALAGSGRRLDVLVGSAGTGKTATLAALRVAWEASHGHGSVLGLAPSATAAHELATALGIGCENVTKWLTESITPAHAERAAVLAALPGRRHAALARGDLHEVRRLDRLTGRLRADQARWQIRPGQLVIVDEASLAGTLDLDQLRHQTAHAGAKLLLVGDHRQLSAVDAGGAFRLLARSGQPTQLTSLWRFRHRWEAHATRRLRDGDPSVLDAYAAHGRIHHGPAEAMLDHAYTAWLDDQTAGHTVLLVAADTRTVTALNQRAHLDRLTTGAVTGPTLPLTGPGCGPNRGAAGVGDRVLTRRNDRTLRTGDGHHVRNGDLWTVTALHPDGALDVTRVNSEPDGQRATVRLPAAYVAEHVDLGYAVTIHRAQGVTVDRAHVLTGPGIGREALYVAMTRGRDTNTVYVATDQPDPDCDHGDTAGPERDPREILTRILATSTAEHSATETRQHADDEAGSLRRLAPIRATIAAAIDRRRWPGLLEASGLTRAQTEQIHHSPAAGALYAALRHAEHLGHRAERVCAGLARQAPLEDADELASVLHHRLSTWLTTAPNLRDTTNQSAAAVLRITDHAGHDEADLDADLAAVDALIHRRVSDLTDRVLGEQPTWLPTGAAPEPSDRHSLSIVAAHEDLTAGATAARESSHLDRHRARLARIASGHLIREPEWRSA
jgi:conjugative relaxase-like TrwC/TraI family protein